MKILVSACLMGENCKYNGGNNRNEKLLDFLKEHEAIPVCPECLGGLPTPRPPAEIVSGVVRTQDGTSVDEQYRTGAALALAAAPDADLAIVQSRSPSCGAKEIYDGTFSRTKIPGKGIFAQLLSDAGIPILDIEDL